MLNLNYIGNEENYEVFFVFIGKNVVQLEGNIPVKNTGFILTGTEQHETFTGNYSDYTTVYRVVNGGVQYSNDGSVYKPIIKFVANDGGSLEGQSEWNANEYSDLIIPTPIPDKNYEFVGWDEEIPTSGKIESEKTYCALFEYNPPLDEVKDIKKEEIISMYDEIMTQGTSVTLSDGSIVNISITQDFINTTNTAYLSAITLYELENILIPFEINNVCYSYSPIDVLLIYITEQQFIVYNKSLKNELLSTLNRKETKEDVGLITYSLDCLDEKALADFQTSMINGNATIEAIISKYGITLAQIQ